MRLAPDFVEEYSIRSISGSYFFGPGHSVQVSALRTAGIYYRLVPVFDVVVSPVSITIQSLEQFVRIV